MKSPTKPNATALLLSGGLDLAACLHFLKLKGREVRGVFVDFGQAAALQERLAVEKLASHFGVPLQILQAKGPSLFGAGEIAGRNAFLILSAMVLGGIGRGVIAIGTHAGTSYYDCSELFLSRMNTLIEEYTGGQLTVYAPFISWYKPEIVKYFMEEKLPLEATYSCELGTIPPCGACASCEDRKALQC